MQDDLVRKQLSITKRQLAFLEKRAKASGNAVASVLREIITKEMSAEERITVRDDSPSTR